MFEAKLVEFQIWLFSWMIPRATENAMAGHMWPAAVICPPLFKTIIQKPITQHSVFPKCMIRCVVFDCRVTKVVYDDTHP